MIKSNQMSHTWNEFPKTILPQHVAHYQHEIKPLNTLEMERGLRASSVDRSSKERFGSLHPLLLQSNSDTYSKSKLENPILPWLKDEGRSSNFFILDKKPQGTTNQASLFKKSVVNFDQVESKPSDTEHFFSGKERQINLIQPPILRLSKRPNQRYKLGGSKTRHHDPDLVTFF